MNAPRTTRERSASTPALSLMRYLCRLVTPPGGLILDPFAGTGTTCIAAEMEGFEYAGIEQHRRHATTARRRLAAYRRARRGARNRRTVGTE